MSRKALRRLGLELFEDRNCPAPLTVSMSSAGNLTVTGNSTALTFTADGTEHVRH